MEASTLNTSADFSTNICANLIETFDSVSLDTTPRPASITYKIVPTGTDTADVIIKQKPQVVPIPEELLQPFDSVTTSVSLHSQDDNKNTTPDLFTSALEQDPTSLFSSLVRSPEKSLFHSSSNNLLKLTDPILSAKCNVSPILREADKSPVRRQSPTVIENITKIFLDPSTSYVSLDTPFVSPPQMDWTPYRLQRQTPFTNLGQVGTQSGSAYTPSRIPDTKDSIQLRKSQSSNQKRNRGSRGSDSENSIHSDTRRIFHPFRGVSDSKTPSSPGPSPNSKTVSNSLRVKGVSYADIRFPTDNPIDPSIVGAQQCCGPGGVLGINEALIPNRQIGRLPQVGPAFSKHAPKTIAETPPPEVRNAPPKRNIPMEAWVKGSHEITPKETINPVGSSISLGGSVSSQLSKRSKKGSKKKKHSLIPELELNPILARPAASAIAHRNYMGSPQAADVRPPELRRGSRLRTPAVPHQAPDFRESKSGSKRGR
ncbi:unnamed protein product [Allacma fusca]|uniref:Uncharacterized protein n=1 Tax=Allacma fusca TaxID=39272 RepID=A0A8J2PAZ5_9HEXA|nr:unnamed protein product [Allacma fusca]